MKKIAVLTLLVLSLAIIVPVFAAPKVALPHRSTWDADMINTQLGDTAGKTGKGVYIAVLDSGLVPNWRDYFPQERIATKLGIGFYQHVQVENTESCDNIIKTEPVHTGSFIGSTGETHGTHVVSTIIGYNYYAPSDIYGGFPNLPPLFVEGIAPEATIIPVKVLDTYYFRCGPGKMGGVTFGTDDMVAAGITYVANLTQRPMIISMSLGGPSPTAIIENAIDYAIGKGVIVVAAAGNAGDAGMDWPGAYPQVISVGASGWEYEWYWPSLVAPPPRYRLWWLQDITYGFNDVNEPTPASEVYITDFSGREKPGQQLDVVAPGSWVRGPFPSGPAYSHLPWWSNGVAWFYSRPGLTNFFYAGGTSMGTPHVSAVAALMLEKNPTLTQSSVESILKSTALPIAAGSLVVFDIDPTQGFYTRTWGADATGAGLVQADAAVAAS